jgi:hypothetical protein
MAIPVPVASKPVPSAALVIKERRERGILFLPNSKVFKLFDFRYNFYEKSVLTIQYSEKTLLASLVEFATIRKRQKSPEIN